MNGSETKKSWEENTEVLWPDKIGVGQAMTIRVAYAKRGKFPPDRVTSDEEAGEPLQYVKELMRDMEAYGLGDDKHGKAMAAGYLRHGASIVALLLPRLSPRRLSAVEGPEG